MIFAGEGRLASKGKRVQPPRRRLRARTALYAALLALVGCQSDARLDYERRISTLQQQIERQREQIAAQQATIDELQRQLQVARGLSDRDLENIYYPDKIEILSLTGGEDLDGQPGDDGVVVYLRPVDRDGDAIKAAGEVRIRLFDLQAPDGHTLVGEYSFSVEALRECWFGKFMTYHYTLHCPWQHGPPGHAEITIRATFIDYLTRRAMSAQTTCTVKLPPADASGSPPSSPAPAP